MAKLSIKPGSTSVLVRIFIQDSTSTIGAGKAGLTAASFTGTKVYVARDNDGNNGGTSVTLTDSTRGTWSSGGIKEKDATNMPGIYEFGLTNASLATGSRSCEYQFIGTGIVPCLLEIDLANDANVSSINNVVQGNPGTTNNLFIAGSNAPTSITGTSNSAGLTLAGNGTGAGLSVTGGATGHGFAIVGGGTSGDGINITTTSGHGVNSAPAGQAKHGIIATGSGNSLGAACDGARFVGGFNGIGLHAIAGGASLGLGGEGAKFEATSGNNNGFTIVGFGTGHGMLSTSGSGATGDGFRAMAASTNGDGFSGISTGTGAGFRSSAIAVGMGATIAQFAAALFTLDTGEVYADAVNGSVVKEIATHAGSGGGDIVSINGTTFVGPNVPCTLATQLAADALDLIHLIAPTGPSTEFVEAFTQLFYRFFPPGPSGEVVKSASDHTIKTKNSAGTTVTTQTWADDGSGSESVGSAS